MPAGVDKSKSGVPWRRRGDWMKHPLATPGTHRIFFLALAAMTLPYFMGTWMGSGEHALAQAWLPFMSKDNAYDLARIESEGFFDDIRNSDWRLMQERMRLTPECAQECGPEPAYAFFQNNWEPNFTCLHERRIGAWGDGGKWVCDPHRIAKSAEKKGCLVYSIGSNNLFDFEESILSNVSPLCEIHTFDHTVGTRPSNLPAHGKVTFHPWGLGNKVKGAFKTLSAMQQELGHGGREIDILKIDCEWCEWDTFRSWFDGWTGPLPRQIQIELHEGTEGEGPLPAHTFMQYLKSLGYVIFHKEPNTMWSGSKCWEFAFIRLGK